MPKRTKKLTKKRKYKSGSFSYSSQYDGNGICVIFNQNSKQDFEAKIVNSNVIVSKTSQQLKNMGVTDGTQIIKITQPDKFGNKVLTSVKDNPIKSEIELTSLLKNKPLEVVFEATYSPKILSKSNSAKIVSKRSRQAQQLEAQQLEAQQLEAQQLEAQLDPQLIPALYNLGKILQNDPNYYYY